MRAALNWPIVPSHRIENALHSLFLLSGMGVLLLALGYLLGGPTGAVFAAGLGLFVLGFSPRVAPSVILRLYGARPVGQNELVEVHQIVAELARRAGLPATPRLYYVPTRVMNAFTLGERRNAAVAVTDGLIRALDLRELTGVLAHELSHLANNDLRVMMLADMISRMTSMLSTVGQLLLLLNLPLLLMGQVTISWLAILLLLGAPFVSMLMQLALSRRREIEADRAAFAMTGDARGLASALAKMERYQQRVLDWLMPGRRIPDPSLLRTHPNTDERIERLLHMEALSQGGRPMRPTGALGVMPSGDARVERPPRWHASGLWY